jgi:hypothetical protein
MMAEEGLRLSAYVGERGRADAEHEAQRDVPPQQPAAPVLGETVGLEHPRRERRVGADHRGPRQQIAVAAQRHAHEHAQHERA